MFKFFLVLTISVFSMSSYAQEQHGFAENLVNNLLEKNQNYKDGNMIVVHGEVYIDNIDTLSFKELSLLYRAIYFGQFSHNRVTYDVSAIHWEIKQGIDRPNFADRFTMDEVDKTVFDVYGAMYDEGTKNVSFFISRKKPSITPEVNAKVRKILYRSKAQPDQSKALIPLSKPILHLPKMCSTLFSKSSASSIN